LKNLILTFDYELFGNGEGDVFVHMIEPTKKILRICDGYGIKVTIFFEVIEYMRLKKEWNKGNAMSYSTNPIEAIENQIQNAAKTGHDIQLHVHPQWVNAKYSERKWILDFNNWRLGDFSSEDGYTIKDLIRDGKNELENIIKPVLPDYRCIAFRAGYYNIMPSEEVYSALMELGLKIDSSIYPGGFENGSIQRFDYRKIPINLGYWWANETDIRNESKTIKEVLEIPVFALSIPRWKKVFTFSKIKSLFLHRNASMSSGAKEKLGKKSLLGKIRFILQEEVFPWDICMFSNSLNKEYFKFIEKSIMGSRNNFVLIGHPKNLQDEKLFRIFLEIAYKKLKAFRFKTIKEQYEEIV
jgi:hypothetical protein